MSDFNWGGFLFVSYLIAATLLSVVGILFVFEFREVRLGRQASELIEACEAELPRNEYCVIVAVPE